MCVFVCICTRVSTYLEQATTRAGVCKDLTNFSNEGLIKLYCIVCPKNEYVRETIFSAQANLKSKWGILAKALLFVNCVGQQSILV